MGAFMVHVNPEAIAFNPEESTPDGYVTTFYKIPRTGDQILAYSPHTCEEWDGVVVGFDVFNGEMLIKLDVDSRRNTAA
jgi:hypothetical protein